MSFPPCFPLGKINCNQKKPIPLSISCTKTPRKTSSSRRARCSAASTRHDPVQIPPDFCNAPAPCPAPCERAKRASHRCLRVWFQRRPTQGLRRHQYPPMTVPGESPTTVATPTLFCRANSRPSGGLSVQRGCLAGDPCPCHKPPVRAARSTHFVHVQWSHPPSI